MSTMFLAAAGGHLRQLVELAERIPEDDLELWVTNPGDQSASLLAGRPTHLVPNVSPKDVGGVLRCVPTAHRLWREHGITRAISTGSAIALGYLPYLSARGVECHYIESATRVVGPSLTGRILQRVPRLHLYSQYDRWACRQWRYGGNIFDGYEAVPESRQLGDQVRVVVMLGIATGFPFRRLVERLLPLLTPDGPLASATGRRVQTLWQTAGTAVDDLPIRARPSMPAAELNTALGDADIVVSHAGTGSAIAAVEQGHMPLLAPRVSALGEIGDEHQRQLADELAGRGLAINRDASAITVDDLMSTLNGVVRRRDSPPTFRLAA
jgi:UDP-N-acetylglucosamine--N-acetylmuramyl-(pentapeptide) pyrophosphoryl-undecaprenol N-acetylglucosamine transferase